MLKYLLTLLILILFGTVFIIQQDIPNGIIESKNYGFILVGIVVGWAFFGVTLWIKNTKIELNQIDILLLFFLGWIIINFSIIKQLTPSVAFCSFIVSVVLSLLLKQIIQTNLNYQHWFSLACLLVGGGQILLGLLQLYGYEESLHAGFKMTGSFHNPGPFGIYVAVMFVFGLGFYLFSKNNILKNISSIVCLLGVLVLPSTQSRSAWMGVLAGSAYLLFTKYGLEYVRKYFSNKYLNISLVAFCVLLGVGLWNFKANSALGRVLTWRVSSEMVKQQPLTGVGFGEFGYQYGFYQADFFKNNPNHTQFVALADMTRSAFNDLLQILIENGIIGFGLFVAMLYLVFFTKTDKSSSYLYASRAGLITLLLASCFSYPFELISTWWLLLFFIGLVSSNINSRFSYMPSIPLKIGLITGFGVLSVYTIQHEIWEYQAKQDWQQADETVQQRDFQTAEKQYAELLKSLPDERLLWLSYGKVLFMSGKAKQSVVILEKASKTMTDPFLLANLGDSYQALKRYDLAIQAYQQASDMVPNRMYPKYLLAKMYLKKQDLVKAKQMAQQIIKMPVKVSSQATTEMLAEMRKVLE